MTSSRNKQHKQLLGAEIRRAYNDEKAKFTAVDSEMRTSSSPCHDAMVIGSRDCQSLYVLLKVVSRFSTHVNHTNSHALNFTGMANVSGRKRKSTLIVKLLLGVEVILMMSLHDLFQAKRCATTFRALSTNSGKSLSVACRTCHCSRLTLALCRWRLGGRWVR